jgi:hypothetical protein
MLSVLMTLRVQLSLQRVGRATYYTHGAISPDAPYQFRTIQVRPKDLPAALR